MESVRSLALEIIEDCFERDMTDWNEIKNKLRDELTSYIYSRTKRKPMILPVIMNI